PGVDLAGGPGKKRGSDSHRRGPGRGFVEATRRSADGVAGFPLTRKRTTEAQRKEHREQKRFLLCALSSVSSVPLWFVFLLHCAGRRDSGCVAGVNFSIKNGDGRSGGGGSRSNIGGRTSEVIPGGGGAGRRLP